MKLSQINSVGPVSNDMCPYKRQEKTQRKEEAELGVCSHLPGKPQKLEKARTEAPLKPQEKSGTP